MEPIVSPWTIYWLQMADAVIGVSVIISIIMLLLLIIPSVINWIDDNRPGDRSYIETRHKGIIKILLVICIILSVFVPSKSTIIGMLVAQKVTPNNVKVATDVLKDAKNELKADVIQLIQAIKDSSK